MNRTFLLFLAVAGCSSPTSSTRTEPPSSPGTKADNGGEAQDPVTAAKTRDEGIIRRIEDGIHVSHEDVAGALVQEENGCDLNEADLEYVRSQLALVRDGAPNILGYGFDAAHYGNRPLKIYLEARPPMGGERPWSHVFAGYQAGYVAEPQPTIFFPCVLVTMRVAPIVHEYTHLLTPKYWSGSLREGIADYVQFTLNPTQAAGFTEPFQDPHALPRELYSQNRSRNVAHAIGEAGHPDFPTSDERVHFYDYSRSFVYHLVDRFGVAAFLRVHDSPRGIEAFDTELESTLPTLRDEWLDQRLGRTAADPDPPPGPDVMQNTDPPPEGDPGPAASDCGDVTYAGYCDGNTVVYCSEGVLLRADCGDTAQCTTVDGDSDCRLPE